ncbi:Tetratricopeptide repeat [Teratosphaeria destructans]|uniref:Tetratricopeptide repeat n=1 Tax=Teratosphaeria destructans TaxID=418781 RepID=A0A9W7SR97_9PEZI|nr:Tetratricopeptide repeat [Teratosphaeria destructans]
MMSLGYMAHELGDPDTHEAITRELVQSGPNNTKDMSALHRLSCLFEDTGRFPEAEAAAREVLPWMEQHPLLGGGRESPQAVGCMRTLARSLWKQGRYAEADDWLAQCRRAIAGMRGGRFAKYCEDELATFEADEAALEAWRARRIVPSCA